jgi:uncharacterized repeat protein (TIGR01451 family)
MLAIVPQTVRWLAGGPPTAHGLREYWLPRRWRGWRVQRLRAATNNHVPPPQVSHHPVADQETVSSGDPIGFTISITNYSGDIASSVTLTDTLPIDIGISWSVSGTDAASCTITAGVLSCNFGDISPGAVRTIRLTSPTPNASPDKASCNHLNT